LLGLILMAGMTASYGQVLSWDPALTGGGSGGTGVWNLNATANWFNGASDVPWTDVSAMGTNTAQFGGTAGTVTVNSSLTASNLQFTTSGYTLAGSGRLTLGYGIDASALNSGTTTVGLPLSLPSGEQLWQVGGGGTLAVNGALSRSLGAAVDFTVPGITTTSLSLTNDATGVIGGWATVNNEVGPTANWAANDGSGNIIAYAGYTAISATAASSQTGIGGASQNWLTGDPADANNYVTTLTTSAKVNSLALQSDVTVNGGVTLTVGNGGLLFSGVSRWLLDGNATTSFLTSGSSTGEMWVHVPDSAATDWTIWTIIKNNGATPLTLMKDGAGYLKLGNLSTYTGGTIVNGGILASTAGTEYGYGKAPTGIITPFGYGSITLNNGSQLQLGAEPGNTSAEYDITNAVLLNGGAIYANDAFEHVKGGLTVGAGGGVLGATFDNKGDPLLNGLAKGLLVDGLVTGNGNLTVQDSGLDTGNAWDSSTVYFTSTGTAAQNTYSGTLTVNNWTSVGGSYLYLIGTNALANAMINLAGDNSASSGRFGSPSLLFGSGTSADGVGYVTIGGLAGSGDFVLADTLVVQSGSSLGAGVALTVGNNNTSSTYSGSMSGAGSLIKTGTGTLTLSGANSYTGSTIVNGGTLALTGGWVASTNITLAHGATLDVSGLGTASLASGQTLAGSGTILGAVAAAAGSRIYAGTDGGYGTNTFTSDLNLAAGSLVYLDVGTVHNGSNDLITVAGTLTANNNIIHIKAPSTLASLQALDYVLLTSANPISGSFASAPSWDVQPVNAGNFSVVTSGNTVTLHYAASTAPRGGGTLTPATVTRNQSVLISIVATNGSGGTVNSVTVDTSAIGGSSSVALVLAGGKLWTNTVSVAAGITPGNYTLVAALTDTVPLTGLINLPLTVTIANDVWNGLAADSYWDSNLNWTNKAAPGYVGDSLEFAGTTGLTASMDNNYTVTGVTFDSGAGSFNINSANGSTLTLTGIGPIVNNSVNGQTLNVPIADAGGGLTKTGIGAVTLGGYNTFTGPTDVKAGSLVISATGTVAPNGLVKVGDTTGTKAVLNVAGGTLLANKAGPSYSSSVSVGAGTNAAGDLELGDNGTLTVAEQVGLGDSFGGYAGFNMSGGTATLGSYLVVGLNQDIGVFNQSGGTMTISANFMTIAAGGINATGVANLSGGSFTANAGSGGTYVGEFGAGTLNISGSAAVTLAGANLKLGVQSGAQGTVNLLGGTLNTAAVYQGAGTGTFNFDGGILQASQGNTTFVNGLSSAVVYSGGAVIDDGGNAISIPQSLLAASGYGVSAIGLTSGGTGYIDSPLVTITGGSGSGATATALVDPLSGTVTNIVVTSPGTGYASGDTLVVTLTGGGGSGAKAATPVLAANVDGGLTKLDTGTLTLAGTNTYLGSTVVSNGTLALTGSLASTNVYVVSGATLDVSAVAYTLGGNQSLSGSGNINGTVTTTAGSSIYAGTDGGYGTNTFNNDLNLVSGAVIYLDLGTSESGSNDELIVNGTLTANNNVIHLKAPSTSASLDTTADYVLITAGALTGSFAPAPVWDVAPANAGHFSIVTSGNSVTLHYNASSTAPTVTATANPGSVGRNQGTRITAKVTPGSAAIASVTIDLSSLGGTTETLVRSNSTSVYTNTVIIPGTATAGTVSLTVTVTDSASLSGLASVPLTIVTSTEVWKGSGANPNWSANPNWVSGAAPGLTGDALLFAGTADLTPNMDNNYSVTSVTFSNNAGSFNIGSANGSTLTITGGGVVNNSAHAQILNVPIVLAMSATVNAASNDVTLPQNIDNGGDTLTASGAHNTIITGTITDSGGLAKTGSGTLTLAGDNIFSGAVNVSAGSLTIPATGSIIPTGYVTVGDTAGSKAVLNIAGGTVGANESTAGAFASSLTVGAVTNAAGDIQMSSGSLAVAEQFGLGNGNGSYAGGTISGGTVTVGSYAVVAFNNDLSVLNLNGGSLTVTYNLLTIGAGDNTSVGVVNVSAGGSVNSTATTGSFNNTIGGIFLGETGNGTLNLFNTGSVALSGQGLDFGANGAAASGTLNLLGGTLTTTAVSQGLGQGAFNFNGGTLQASAANATFMGGLTRATLYSGGAVIDDGGFAIGISQPLLAPTGYGVSAINLSSGGTGYLDSPIVTITGGSGSGATATALVNPASGAVTNIVVTSPGTGYAISDILVVTLTGGGGSGATASTPVLAANLSGGLTKLNTGTLTLSGANAYTGNTLVEAGTLELVLPTLATNATVTVASGAALQLDFTATNRVAGLILNGVSQVPGIYNSTTASPFITGSGSLVVASAIASNPTNITAKVSGSTLTLTWPTDHLGWLVQSNSVNLTVPADWHDLPGTGGSTSYSIGINPSNANVFYRLRKP
jgi:autotransporter-associated beta strand protein